VLQLLSLLLLLTAVAAEVAAMSDDEEEEEFDPANLVHCTEKALELAMLEAAQRPTVELVSSADFRKAVLKHYAEVTEAESALDAEQTAAIDARLKERECVCVTMYVCLRRSCCLQFTDVLRV
jgi:hypothetical protein